MTTSDKNLFRDDLTVDFFNPVLFIADGKDVPLDTTETKYLYSDKGHSTHLTAPRGTLIQVAEEAPSVNLGRRYGEVTSRKKTIGTGSSAYEITEFGFGAERVVYEPLWATRAHAQAFGMTLVQNDESLLFTHEGLVTTQYVYGKYAGYQSPYIGDAGRRELRAVNATDLEYHAFAHVFCSQDDLPLVISVARYRAEKREIWLADLWVKPGDCLYVPPKVWNPEVLDLHGNRNSALACWGVDGRNSVTTRTISANAQVFADPVTKPRFHEETTHTIHTFPPGFPASEGGSV